MSLNSATIEILLAKGLTGDDLLAVARAMEMRSDPTAAARMAKHRASKAATRNVTRNTPPNDSILTPHEKPSKPSGLVAKPKKHRLPIDWEPMPFTVGSIAALTVARWEPGRLERELAKFRDHHTAAGTQWENWQAAWGKWVNGSQDFGGRNGGQHHSNIGRGAQAFAALNLSDDRPM